MDKFLDQFAEFPAMYKYVALAVVVALSIGLFWYFIYQDKKQQIDRLNRDLQRLQVELQKAEAYADRYDEFKEELRIVDLKLTKALKKLPASEEIPDLLDRINEAVIDAGLKISFFGPGGLEPQEFYKILPVQINVSGGYHNFAAFADVISQMERIVTLKDISLSPSSETTGELTILCFAVTFMQESQIQELQEE